MDYSKFISKMALNRKPSGISEMRTYLRNASPSLVWLASGVPNAQKFPYKEATFTLEDGKVITIKPDVMATCLQYGPTTGYPPLLNQLREMTFKIHSPPCWPTSDVIVTLGCQDGMAKAIEMILNPGDSILVEEPCYSDTLCILSAVTPNFLRVDADEYGMCPDALKRVLQETEKNNPDKMPKLMYLVPNASNPAGKTMNEERKRRIYALASEYDFIILEDDPYYHLQFGDPEKLAPSFLSLDTDGRVLRMDSFSKIVSAGLRVGYVTGPVQLLNRIVWHMQASVLCPPGITQVMISELLKEWGDEGFRNHITNLRNFYKSQRDVMLQAADTHLKGLCEWTVPDGGIFVWFKVLGVKDTENMIKQRAVKKDVMLVPGNNFMLDTTKPCQYMRAAYSNVTPEQIMVAFKNLAELIREEIALQDSLTTA
ncbi:kynurenine/alpha-aminoadipate aminotransferase, mitochondrial-like [Macrobrachium rosenbergii]|uniref:kynurenine/alpha-aminoadipate aminotransferase, mitochondrial-like n=1 Tax=Macrobrachium rosenbergii TaxID=79674 RepID=UPI0034D5D0AA